MPKLIENVKYIKIGLYFDVLLEIVLNIDIGHNVYELMKELTSKVLVVCYIFIF